MLCAYRIYFMVDLPGTAPGSCIHFYLLHTAITYIILPADHYVNRGIANYPMSLTFRQALHPPKSLCDFTISDAVIYFGGIGTVGTVGSPGFATTQSLIGNSSDVMKFPAIPNNSNRALQA